MREIEFRAKRPDNNEWFYGFYSPRIWFPTFEQTPNIKTFKGTDFEIDINTLGQYTGLKDKNGTKIYEGDVLIGDIPELVSSQNLIGIVEYEESAFIIRFPNRKSWQIQKVGFCSFMNYRVIGNLYDNPELIKE